MNILPFNLKGGCGKTTLTVNTAVLAEQVSEPCLVLDADPQKNSSRFLSRYAKRDFNPGSDFSIGSLTVTGDASRIASTSGLVLVDAPPDYRFIQNFDHSYKIDVLLLPIDGTWAADGSIEVIQQIQQISPGTKIVLWANKAYDSKFSRAELNQLADELDMVRLFRYPIPASEYFKKSETYSQAVWDVSYATRSIAATNMKILCNWILDGCNDDETYLPGEAARNTEFSSYRSRRAVR